jgi:rhodanese-related sulfurtransferase
MVPAPMPVPVEVDVHTAAQQFAAGALLLDVREPDELACAALPGATHIPLRVLPLSLDRIPRDRDILVLCHHGARSRMVTGFLRAQGFDRVSNVAGGIDAWSQLVDPGLPRY